MYLDENMKGQVKERLEAIENKIYIDLYLNENEESNVLKGILGEIKELNEKIIINEKTDNIENKPLAKFYSDTTKGVIEFHGVPAGYEFGAILDLLVDTANNSFESNPEEKMLREYLDTNKDKKVDLKVFVTPTCPHCPPAAYLGYKLGNDYSNFNVHVIEANSFPELSNKYNVQYVPKIVINEKDLPNEKVNFVGILDAIKN
ncbi:MAG: thioredoxin family protein [Candidatus Nanoarchaeia archaeon]|nr:thioredoxin family protein [Candidatus Nanoarchaeia archaeon]